MTILPAFTRDHQPAEPTDPLGLRPLLQRLDYYLLQALDRTQANREDIKNRSENPEPTVPASELQTDELQTDELQTDKSQTDELQTDCPLPIPTVEPPAGTPIAWFCRMFGLSEFEQDVVILALAPEIDRRYESIYAQLQPQGRSVQPTVDLALRLFCDSWLEHLAKRACFSTQAPLIRHDLLHLIPPVSPTSSTLLAHELHLNDQVVRLLLDQPGLDARLAADCQLLQPTQIRTPLPLRDSEQQALFELVGQYWQSREPLYLYFQGADRPGKQGMAEALAIVLEVPLLVVQLAQLEPTSLEATLKRVLREAQFREALLYLEDLDALQRQPLTYQTLWRVLAQSPGVTILSGIAPYFPSYLAVVGVITIPFAIPTVAQRQTYWQAYTTAIGLSLPESELVALSERFQLTATQIADAVLTTERVISWQQCRIQAEQDEAPEPIDPLPDLFAAARDQAGQELTALARKIEPHYGWEDIVLPLELKTQLREICNQAKHRHQVYETWGFSRKLSLGKGLNVLFAGQPGTGKTMAAEVIAQELQLDLYKIDLSQVVDKYIGETEKNLNRIFTAAANSNAILLFDEADALFGKRSEVKDAHDRYANIEIGYLLQKMEEYEGIAILTTNLQANLDAAFVRRLRFILEFPMPSQAERRRIWQQVWPSAAPLSPDLDLDGLAERFEISGATVRNVAFAAAFLAADQGEAIGIAHVMRAMRQEYQKMGKLLRET